jgi:signal peptide peptidase SppA
MNYPRIFERVYGSPHLITRERFLSIHQVLISRMSSGADSAFEAAMMEGTGQSGRSTINGSGRRAQRAAPMIDGWTGTVLDHRLYTFAKPGVAVVPVYGVLAKNLSSYEESCGGGTDINPIAFAMSQADADPEVQKIVLDIDSPGGEVTGVPELGARIRDIDTRKPVIAFSDALTASGAQWIGSSARESYATSSSRHGSIGVYSAWLDETVALEMRGLKLELFTAGKHKAAGAPFRGLTDEERDMIQANVTRIHQEFRSAVRLQRPGVSDDSMEGQVFDAREALQRGLIDGIVGDWEEFLSLV